MGNPSTAYVEETPGQWRAIEVQDGSAQGDTSSTPSFSRAYRDIIERVKRRLLELGIGDVIILSLVDDLVTVSHSEHVDTVVICFSLAPMWF